MMDKEITFYLLGAQKCATTWLYHCLNDHPKIFIGGNKREDLYLGGEKYLKEPDQWFNSLYSEASESQILGSASVEYINDIEALTYINKFSSSPKFILSIRNPVERAISAYNWKIRKGLIVDIDINDYLHTAINNFCKGNASHGEKYDDIIDRGIYFENMEKYILATEPDRFKLILYDEIKENPQKVIVDIYNFLNVPTVFRSKNMHRIMKANNYYSFLSKLERKYFDNNRILKSLYRGINELVLMKVKNKKNLIYKNVHKEILQELHKIYKKPNIKLIEIIKKYVLLNDAQCQLISQNWR